MKLSIIMVSYNEKDYLAEAIESCLNNDFEYELIIGDDGSCDGSIELLEEYSEKYPNIIKYFVMDRLNVRDVIPSIRVSNVLKRAFEICKGDYITVISGDDVNTISDRYTHQIAFLDNNNKYNSCYIDYKKFWNDGREQDLQLRTSLPENVFWAVQYVHVSCFVFRRECLTNILDRFCDDTGLIFSILSTGKSKHLKIKGFGYRQRDKSIMHEADMVELSILEIALFQDCLNHGSMKKSSLARFAKPLQYLRNNRQVLNDTKYEKYIQNCAGYSNNMLKLIIENSNIVSDYVISGNKYFRKYQLLRKFMIMINTLFSI